MLPLPQIPASISSPPRGEGCSLPAPAGPPCLTSGCVFLAAAFRVRLPVRRCVRGACGGGGDGGGASAFPMWASLPSQPFSKAKASFLDVPVEARPVWACCWRLGRGSSRVPEWGAGAWSCPRAQQLSHLPTTRGRGLTGHLAPPGGWPQASGGSSPEAAGVAEGEPGQ